MYSSFSENFKMATGQVKIEYESDDSDMELELGMVKIEQCEIGTVGINENSNGLVSKRNPRNPYVKYEVQEDEIYGVTELSTKNIDFTGLSKNECKAEHVKTEDDIDIHYNDIKREIIEENYEGCRLGEVCNENVGDERKFTRDCLFQRENELNCNGIQGKDMTQDVKPSLICGTTDLELQYLKVKEEITSGDDSILEEASSSIFQRGSGNSMVKYKKTPTSNLIENDNLVKYQELDIGKTKQLVCSVIPISVNYSSQLKIRERNHIEKNPLNCQVCSKVFTTHGNLRRHERIHSGEKPFLCKICLKAYTRSNYLRVHARIHRGESLFLCKICSKSFTCAGNLKLHEKIHTGDKPYNCQYCSKDFNKMGNLKDHERIHTGDRPFLCRICSATFTHSSNWKKHEKTHTHEKRFICKICSKAFTRSGNLTIHQKIHMRKTIPVQLQGSQ